MNKIAFCFLIYDCINHEEIWNIFFHNVDSSKYNIYIHYKLNKPLKYFEQYKLKNCIETKYNHISLVKAQNVLLEEALKDTNNKHFIFLSNSCVPFKPFYHVYNTLKEEYSYFNIAPHSTCFPRCNSILQHIEKQYIQKAGQWCILNRKHASLMLNKNEYIQWFNNTSAPDEHCYITNIHLHNLQNELITTPNLPDGATTFTNWSDMNYKYPCKIGLMNYKTISEEEIQHLLNSKCLFGRKFTIECFDLLSSNTYTDRIKSAE